MVTSAIGVMQVLVSHPRVEGVDAEVQGPCAQLAHAVNAALGSAGFAARRYPAPEVVGTELALKRVVAGFASNVHLRVAEIDDPRIVKGMPNVLLTRLPFDTPPEVRAGSEHHPFADYRLTTSLYDELWVTTEAEQSALKDVHPSVHLFPSLALGAEMAGLGEHLRREGRIMELVGSASHLSDVLTSPLVYYGKPGAAAAEDEMSTQAEVLPLTILEAVEHGRCNPRRVFFCSLDEAGAVALLAPLCDAFGDLVRRYPDAMLLLHLPHTEQKPGAALRLLQLSTEFHQLNLATLRCANIRVVASGHPDQVARRMLPCAAFHIQSPLPTFDAHLAGLAAATSCLPIHVLPRSSRSSSHSGNPHAGSRVRVAPSAWQKPGWFGPGLWPSVSSREVLAALEGAIQLPAERHAALVSGTQRNLSRENTQRWLASRLSAYRTDAPPVRTEQGSRP